MPKHYMPGSTKRSDIRGIAGYKLSRHAKCRMQQRCISPAAVELILDYGDHERSYGADKFFLSKKARAKIASYLGRKAYAAIKANLDIFVILSDCGEVITTGYRLQRIR